MFTQQRPSPRQDRPPRSGSAARQLSLSRLALLAKQVVPHFGGTPIEEVAAASQAASQETEAPPPLFFQLYPPRDKQGGLDREHTRRVLRHAEAHGCAAVVVTVDTPVDGNPRLWHVACLHALMFL